MTGPIEQDVPLLGLGREQTQAWTQAMLTMANALRHHRMERQREAWSAQAAASRVARQYERDLDPRIKVMADADHNAFKRDQANGASGFEEKSSWDAQFGWSVWSTIGPMPEDAPSGSRGAWGLWVHGTGNDKELAAFVVVPDQELARKLQDEVTRGEQRTIRSLVEVGTYGFMRAEHAHSEVRESDRQLRERMANNLYQAWPGDAELVAAVIRPSRGEDNDDYSSVDGLAHQLRNLEERGYAMSDVLSRIDPASIRARWAQEPRFHPVSFVQREISKLTDERLHVVDADPVDPAVSREVALELERGLVAADIDPQRVYDGRFYDQLRAQLSDLRSEGRDLAPLLADLPGKAVSDARDPAAYLRRVVENRVRAEAASGPDSQQPPREGPAGPETEAGIRKTRPDLGRAETMLRRYVAPQTAEAVIACRTWPGLGKQLLAWKAEGAPVGQELARVREDAVRDAKQPAVYLRTLLRRGIDFRRRHSGASDDQRVDGRVVAAVPDPFEADPAPHPATEAVRDGVPASPFLIRELDPTNIVDRAALEMSRGAGTIDDDVYIEQMLNSRDPGETWWALNRAEAALGRAEDLEREAIEHARTPDDPATVRREDLVGLEAAQTDEQLAGREHALAQAEAEGAPTAAAQRAELAHRPPGTLVRVQQPPTPRQTPRPAAPAPAPRPTPVPQPVPRRPR